MFSERPLEKLAVRVLDGMLRDKQKEQECEAEAQQNEEINSKSVEQRGDHLIGRSSETGFFEARSVGPRL